MSTTVTIDPEHLAEVRAVLAEHLPPGIEVKVFGSRANGRIRRWSDLDLVLDGGAPLPLALMGELAEAFDESSLPWKVDLVDRRSIGEAFGAIVDASSVPLA